MNQTLEISFEPIISDELKDLLRLVSYGFISQAVSIFGCVANIVNMVVFYKLGFNDTINLSLFALAFSDFGAVLTLIWLNICVLPWFQDLDLPFDPNQIQFLIASWPHIFFARITTLITAYIMAERCLCVTVPLKVKSILTRKRVTMFLLSAYGLVLASAIPIYYSNRYAMKWYPNLNKTIVGLVFTTDKAEIEAVLGPLQNVLFALIPFIFICVCTVVLVVSLKKKAAWREQATTGSKQSELSKKESRVAKMVAVISVLFISCYFLNMIANTMILSHTDFDVIRGKQKNLMMTFGAVAFTLEAINSSMNIFVYYKFSTNYRDMFNQIFRLEKNKA